MPKRYRWNKWWLPSRQWHKRRTGSAQHLDGRWIHIEEFSTIDIFGTFKISPTMYRVIEERYVKGHRRWEQRAVNHTFMARKSAIEFIDTLTSTSWKEPRKRKAKYIPKAKPQPDAKHRFDHDAGRGNWYYLRQDELDKDGNEVRFCYSKHRNEAGFFLTWRDRRGDAGSDYYDDDMVSAFKTKRQAKQKAHLRQAAYRDGRLVV